MSPLTLDFAAAFGRVLHRHEPVPRCRAAGWLVRAGCACDGQAICPVCTRPVAAKADPAHPGAIRLGGHAR